MEEKTKYMLMGLAIEIVIGAVMLYLLVQFRIIRPFGMQDFMRPENMRNFTEPFMRR